MSDDIVTRLRKAVCWCNDYDGRCYTCEAADVIEQLRAKLIAAFDDIGRCHAIIDQLRKDNPT